MGMSTSICGIKPADDKFQKMKAIYDACEAAGIPVPNEVNDFFGDNMPDLNGVIVPLHKYANRTSTYHKAITEVHVGYPEAGFYVDVTKLPPDVKIIKFSNSW
jgi:hypothetical protein